MADMFVDCNVRSVSYCMIFTDRGRNHQWKINKKLSQTRAFVHLCSSSLDCTNVPERMKANGTNLTLIFCLVLARALKLLDYTCLKLNLRENLDAELLTHPRNGWKLIDQIGQEDQFVLAGLHLLPADSAHDGVVAFLEGRPQSYNGNKVHSEHLLG